MIGNNRAGAGPVGGIHNKNKMSTIAYILIGLGLLLTFILWRTWKNQDRLIREFNFSNEEIEDTLKSIHWKIYICYGLAIVFNYFL